MQTEVSANTIHLELPSVTITDNFQETTLEDKVAMSATVQDSLPFLLESLTEEVRTSLGHQVNETIPLCTYDGVNCDMEM